MLKLLVIPAFFLLLIAQWLVLVQMIWKKEKVLTKGLSYKFRTAPVDPSDPFRGKYIVLNFDENSHTVQGAQKFPYNSPVYVTFYSDKEGFARIQSVNLKKPGGTNFLETTVNYLSDEKDSTTIFLNYPFTNYYMDEYKAPAAERLYRDRAIDTSAKVYALVKIYDGDAIVKDVYVNDSLIVDVIKSRNKVR